MPKKALLVLQGGGAMGAFQCGAYRAIAHFLKNRRIELAGIAGASIGAVNAALIAANTAQADGGADALEHIWREDMAVRPLPFFPLPAWYWNCWNGLLTMLFCGHPRLSSPNVGAWSPLADPVRARAPLHMTSPLEAFLEEKLGSYGPHAPGQAPLLLVRALDTNSQRPVSFHSWQGAVTPRHIRASASAPIIFPMTDIAGSTYMDGDIWPHTPLADLLAALNSAAAPEADDDGYLVFVIEMMSGEKRPPTSLFDALYQAQAGMTHARVEADLGCAEATNRYLDFLADCEAEAASLPKGAAGAPLRARIAEERRRAEAAGLTRLRIVDIRREPLPYEYVSRDLDYSAARIERLIEQGYDCARKALAGL